MLMQKPSKAVACLKINVGMVYVHINRPIKSVLISSQVFKLWDINSAKHMVHKDAAVHETSARTVE